MLVLVLPIHVNIISLFCAHNLLTERTGVRECVGKMLGLDVCPDFGPHSLWFYFRTQTAGVPAFIISQQVIIQVLWTSNTSLKMNGFMQCRLIYCNKTIQTYL